MREGVDGVKYGSSKCLLIFRIILILANKESWKVINQNFSKEVKSPIWRNRSSHTWAPGEVA